MSGGEADDNAHSEQLAHSDCQHGHQPAVGSHCHSYCRRPIKERPARSDCGRRSGRSCLRGHCDRALSAIALVTKMVRQRLEATCIRYREPPDGPCLALSNRCCEMHNISILCLTYLEKYRLLSGLLPVAYCATQASMSEHSSTQRFAGPVKFASNYIRHEQKGG